jgi:lycopene cyclase CruP
MICVPISAKQREQEWNISRKELMDIVEIGILSEAEIEQIISSDFNPVRFLRL